MMKRRILMIFLVMVVIMTSMPMPAMAAPVESAAEISISGNSVTEETSGGMTVDDYIKMNGYVAPEEVIEDPEVSTDEVSAERASSVTYPAKYDPRTENKVSAVRSQVGGTCWLFSSVAAIESNLIHQGLADSTIDLSEFQIPYFLFHPYEDPLGYYSDNTGKGKNKTSLRGDTLWDFLMSGGSESVVAKFLESGVSPVYESEAPFYTNLQEGAYGEYYYAIPTEEEINARVLDESLTDKKYFRMKDVHGASTQDWDEVKKLITDYGAASTGYYSSASTRYLTVGGEGGDQSYYSGYSYDTNHAICIVGWDDNYPAENFALTPPGDGAWLCKNSWGNVSDQHHNPSSGYLWISYYEGTLRGACAFEMEAYNPYDSVYHEAGGGTRLSPSLVFQPTTTDPVRYITTYTAKAHSDGSAEKLYEITQFLDCIHFGFGEATLYLNPVIEDGEIISYSYKRKLEDKIVDWSDNSVYIPSGTIFAIYHERPPIPDDYGLDAVSLECPTYDVWTVVTRKADMQCSTSVTLSKESLEMQQGETETLSATILPTNTTMNGVSYHSTNPNIVAVDENGTVTPTGVGSCEIIAMAWDGRSSDRCAVTVRTASVGLEDTTVAVGQSAEMTPVYTDGFLGDSADKYSWSVSDTSMASIDENGEITGIKTGSVTVSAYLKSNPSIKASCSVKVIQPITGLTFGKDYLGMTEGESKRISASLVPADAENANIEYTLEGLYGVNPVTYENGVLTAVTSGQAILTAQITGTNIKKQLSIAVQGPATAIIPTFPADVKNVVMTVGAVSELCFNVNVEDESRICEILSAVSSNENVVKVLQKPYFTAENGTVCTIQAVAAGSANVTIKSNDSRGEMLVYNITVTGGTSDPATGTGVKPSKITVDNVVYMFEGNELTVTKAQRDLKTYEIKSYITHNGKKYKVTKIGANAFKNHSKLRKITVPDTVTSIGKKAFYNCKKLKTVTIKSKVITSVGKNAFKKIKKNATIKVPKKKLKAYKKLLKGKIDKNTKIKK